MNLDTTDQHAELIAKVTAIKVDEDLSYAALANETGIKRGTLSSFMGGTYAGDNDRIARDLKNWLEAREQQKTIRAKAPSSPDFIMLPTAARMIEAMRFAQTMSDIAVVASDPGFGKSTAIKYFAETSPNVWVVFVEPRMKTVNQLVSAIAEEVDVAGGHFLRVIRQVQDKIANRGGVLILDEAQYLSIEMLNQLRAINEKYQVGIVLFGNRNIHAKIEGKSRDVSFAQFFSRLGMRLNLTKPRDEDILPVIEAWGITDPDARDKLRAIGKKPGALRNIDKTMKLASIAAAGAGKPVCAQYIHAAYERLARATD